jgi:hypothetical protein
MKMKLKDKLVLEALTKVIYALDTAIGVFAKASGDLINRKCEILAKYEEGQDES